MMASSNERTSCISREDVLALESRLYRAMIEDDHEALGALLSSQSCYIHSTGVMEDRDTYLRALRDGLYEYDEVRSIDPQVRIFGEVATMVGRALMVVGARGQPKNQVHLLTTLIWAREEDGNWRLHCRHATRVP